MSSFSKYVLQFPEQVNLIAISNQNNNPTVAVVQQTQILFYDQSGQLVEGKSVSKKTQATCIDWNPVQKQLAIGWKSGCVSIYSEESNTLRDEVEAHKNPIVLLRYNPSGGRMITSDNSGLISVWRGLTCLSKYQRSGLINHACFAELSLDSNQKLGNLFFFGGALGVVTLADDSNHLSEICKVGGSIAALQFYQKQNSVIIISSSLLLVQFRISTSDKNSAPEKKVKLSIAGDPTQLQSIWVGDCLLCTSSSENMIRLWHLDEDENYVLTMFDHGQNNDKINQIQYDSKGKLMVAGTSEGRLVFWKNRMEQFQDRDCWKEVITDLKCTGSVKQICSGNGLIAARYDNQVLLVQETMVTGKIGEKIQVLQISSNLLKIYYSNDKVKLTKDITCPDNQLIKGYDLQGRKLMVMKYQSIMIYDIIIELGILKQQDNIQANVISTIVTDCRKAYLTDQYVIAFHLAQINIMNFQGNVKQEIPFPESEGYICDISITQQFLVAHTTKNLIKIFDLSRREAKASGIPRKFQDSQGKLLGEINSCNINKIGNRVLIISKDRKCYIYDLEIDVISWFTDNVIKAIWDKNDDRFFAIEKKSDQNKQFIETFFYSSEKGVKKLDEYKYELQEQEFFSLVVPNIYFFYKQQDQYQIQQQLMKDFQGLEVIDDIVIQAIMNFNFNLCIGNLDEAYKSVKQIQNPVIWENMAQMCVKTGRLDVAEICIGNMKFARGAKAVREAKKEPEQQAKLAMVAIQLNMLDEAQNLYTSCQRFDLLNKMYQAQGNWQAAVKIAQDSDRINLKNTYFNTAKILETERNFSKAIEYYELANCHHKEVPRMFLQAQQLPLLKDYIDRKEDKILYKWWAQYLESIGNFEDSNQYYKLAEDFSSMIRIMINQNDLDKAKKFCNTINNAQASLILAKQLEVLGLKQEAINFYAKALNYSHAVRLAREMEMDSEIMSLSLMSMPRCMNMSAEYFEQKGFHEKAIILYMKAKNIKKALNLAVKSKLYDYIQKITQNLGEEEDIEVLSQVAEYFISNNQFDKAIHLLVASKQVERALDIFVQNNIPITDEIAAQFQLLRKLLPKDFNESDQKSVNTLKVVASKAKKQGNFELAARLYRQLKDNIKAMKCICKLNDVEKVITFAQNARNTEIYIIAGNFLQSADWHSSPDIMKNIISFYTKAKAYDRLAIFYESCSNIEIDEYKDYKKAIMAIKDSLKFWQKAGNEEKAQIQTQKIFLIEKFNNAIDIETSDPNEMHKILISLLQNPVCEQAIRIGDIYAPIIEFFYRQGNIQSAYQYLKALQDKQINIHLYLNKDLVQTINNAVGIKPQAQQVQQMNIIQNKVQSIPSRQQQEQEEDEEVFEEEEINEDIL